MPTITKCVSSLIRIPYDNIQLDRAFFSNLHNANRRQNGCTVFAPTVGKFACIWNLFDQQHDFVCSGDDIESCKQSLCDNVFPLFRGTLTTDNIFEHAKNIAWVRMVLALNMYADVRRHFSLQPYGRVDIVLSSGSSRFNYHRYEIRQSMYNVYRVLYAENSKLSSLGSLTKVEFWRRIFEIYDDQTSNHQRENLNRRNVENAPIVEEVLISAIAQEYLNRDENVVNIIPNNKQIAGMIAQIDDLPVEIRKSIYDTCIAFYISHPRAS